MNFTNGFNRTNTTITTMSSIIIPVYVYAAIAAVVALIISIVLSNGVAFRPDMSDVGKRKGIFWFTSIAAPVLTFALAFLLVYISLKTGSKKSTCMLHMSIGAIASWVLYIIVGFVVSKANPKGKLGSWF